MNPEFSTKIKNNVAVISCPKRLDIQNADGLKDILARCVERQIYRIVMDLSRTRYIDSSGLGAIVSTISALRTNEGDIRLAAASDNISNLLEITHLNKVLVCHKSVKEGIESFNRDRINND